MKTQKLKAAFGFGSVPWLYLFSSCVPFFFFPENNLRHHVHKRRQMDVIILFSAFQVIALYLELRPLYFG